MRRHYSDLDIANAVLAGDFDGIPKGTASRWRREGAEYLSARERDAEAEPASRVGRALKQALDLAALAEGSEVGTAVRARGEGDATEALAAYATAIAAAPSVEEKIRIGLGELLTIQIDRAREGEGSFEQVSDLISKLGGRYAQITRPQEGGGAGRSPLVAILNQVSAS
ncbi:MAG TPA: hypothetical protein EYQ24_10470 [Bacteroidetes bacterium]|nr:hypothetical protein [Bacteroidota bacterium]